MPPARNKKAGRSPRRREDAERPRRRGRGPWYALLGGIGLVVLLVVAVAGFARRHADPPEDPRPIRRPTSSEPRSVHIGPVTLWWDDVPAWVARDSVDTGRLSNIRRADYVGPQECGKCHKENYAAWSQHPHRWMNAVATDETVRGDFSGEARISYLGGEADFYHENGQPRMRLRRGDLERVYAIRQTIGSRFQQYYIGRLLQGPEPAEHPAYRVNHVLPFGYWLDREAWVPTVHVHLVPVGDGLGDEEGLPDGQRPDPFARDVAFTPYAERCSHCHTTIAFGDLLIRNTETLGVHAPFALDLSLPGYLGANHGTLWNATRLTGMRSFRNLVTSVLNQEPVDHAAALGISCEACHLGGRQHAEGRLEKPLFFPAGASLFASIDAGRAGYGRTATNVNWSCGRCHAGERPQFAAGMSTWNSTEFTDAMRGSCYSQLRCIDCHDPHEATGRRWSRTPSQDDASCLQCHQQFESDEARRAHTHHAPDSAGSRCMNCHMPRLNEGMQDVVRTHMIFSPTHAGMIESNQPNACNLCHTDKPIGWTTQHLASWYGATFDREQIAAHTPRPEAPAPLNWLQNEVNAVRLVAADALTRSRATWALPQLVDCLDDPFLLNRQFAQTGLETMLDVRLSDYGYRYYLDPQGRRQPIARLREAFCPPSR